MGKGRIGAMGWGWAGFLKVEMYENAGKFGGKSAFGWSVSRPVGEKMEGESKHNGCFGTHNGSFVKQNG
jgi:hypothetical protein